MKKCNGMLVATLVYMGFAAEGSLGAQPSETVRLRDDAPSCTSCGVRLVPVRQYGDASGRGALRGTVRLVVRDAANRLWVTYEDGGPPQVFQPDGRTAATPWRSGDGPGEFRMPAGVVPTGSGETLVFDAMLKRVNVFDANLRFKSSRAVDVTPYDAVPFRAGVFVAADVRSGQGAGKRFHQLNQNGTVQESFRLDGLEASAANGRFERHHVAVTSDVRCAVREWQFAIACAAPGASSFTMRIEAPWFDTKPRRIGTANAPLSAHIKALVALDNRHMALAVLRPSPTWEQHVVARNGPDGRSLEIEDYDGYFDTVIVVVDVVNRGLVSTTHVPQAVLYAPSRGHLAGLAATDAAEQVVLWRVEASLPR